MASLSVGSQPHAAVEQSNQAVGKSFLDKHGKKILVAVAVLSIAAVAVAILANPPIAAALGLAAIIAKFSVLTSASTALVAIPVIKVGSIITGILGLSMLVGQTGITAGSALGAAGTAIINKLKKIRDNFGEVDGVPVMKRRLGVMGKDNAFAILKPKDPTCHSHKLNIDGRVMKCEITVNFEKDTWNRDKTITFINGKSVQSFQQEGCSADRFLEHMASQFPKAMPVENKRHLLENLTKAMMQSHALMGNELYGEYYGEQLGTQLTTKSGTDTRQVDVTINEEAIVVTVIQQSMFIDVEALIRGDVVQREGSFKSQYSFDPRTGRTLDMQVTFLPLESVAE